MNEPRTKIVSAIYGEIAKTIDDELLFKLTKLECESLVKEFSHSFINVNENPLASEVMERMIKFIEDK